MEDLKQLGHSLCEVVLFTWFFSFFFYVDRMLNTFTAFNYEYCEKLPFYPGILLLDLILDLKILLLWLNCTCVCVCVGEMCAHECP